MVVISSPFFPSSIGVVVGIFTGTEDQEGLCCMGSFMSQDKSSSSSVENKGKCVLAKKLLSKGKGVLRLEETYGLTI